MSETQTIRIALAQLNCEEGNKERNLQKIEESLQKAYAQQADILVLPEMMLTGFANRQTMFQLAETRDGPSIRRLKQMIERFPVAVVFTFPEYVSDDRIHNTACFLDNKGETLAFYRKTHLFASEKAILDAGDQMTDFTYLGIKMGMLTCFDIEFPEAARTLGMRGVKLLLVDSANMSPYEFFHRNFILSRAIENHCFVAYSNRIGQNINYTYHGESAVVSPDGRLMMEIERDREEVRTVEIAMEEIALTERVFRYFDDRRPELYE